jgi:prepilin-type N-terminal cleavage/methylation domain-containing protein/prepilin-type processing-associated H-X9-DG protein
MKRLIQKKKTKKYFTLIELLIVIAIIGILASMLLPALSVAREVAKEAACKNNLKQAGLGMIYYIENYNQYLPYYSHTDGQWYDHVVRELGDDKLMNDPSTDGVRQIFKCPSQKIPFAWDTEIRYGYNYLYLSRPERQRMTSAKHPDTTIAIADADASMYGNSSFLVCVNPLIVGWGSNFPPANRHGGGKSCNIIWLDWHVTLRPMLETWNNLSLFKLKE